MRTLVSTTFSLTSHILCSGSRGCVHVSMCNPKRNNPSQRPCGCPHLQPSQVRNDLARHWYASTSLLLHIHTCTFKQHALSKHTKVLAESNPSPGCGWPSTVNEDGSHNATAAAAGCQFIADLISSLKARGVNVGTYASEYEWSITVGSSCTSASSTPLWYAHYDNDPSFSDFAPFGGWTTPAVKQYSGTHLVTCMADVTALPGVTRKERFLIYICCRHGLPLWFGCGFGLVPILTPWHECEMINMPYQYVQ
jgi:hypothetical protein